MEDALRAGAAALRERALIAHDAALLNRTNVLTETSEPSPTDPVDCLRYWAIALGHYDVAGTYYNAGDITLGDYHAAQGDFFRQLAEDCLATGG